jgi:putative MATE family efflux protein
LDWILIYPAGMGVAGAAWATVVSQVVVAVWFLKVLVGRFEAPRWRFDLAAVRPLLNVGAELVVRTGALLAALTFATSIAARMGTIDLAAWQIAMQIFLLLSLTMDAIAIAAQSLIATALGADDRVAANRTGNRLLELGLVLGIVLGLALWACSAPLASLFTDDASVHRTATQLLRFLALSQPVGALAFTLDGILIGALETRFMAKAMVTASIVFAAGSYVAFVSGSGTSGLALGAGLWLLVRLVATYGRYRTSIGPSGQQESVTG